MAPPLLMQTQRDIKIYVDFGTGNDSLAVLNLDFNKKSVRPSLIIYQFLFLIESKAQKDFFLNISWTILFCYLRVPTTVNFSTRFILLPIHYTVYLLVR